MGMLKKFISIISLSAALSFGTSAYAALMTVDATYKGFNGGSGSIRATHNGKVKTVSVGMMKFEVNQQSALPFALPGMFDGFCMEFEQQILSSKMTYTIQSLDEKFGVVRGTAIAALYTKFNKMTTGLVEKMAFQMSLWEIVNDYTGDWTKLTFSSGAFRSTSTDASLALASSWLKQLNGVVPTEKVYALSNNSSQDQLLFYTPPPGNITQVPVSASMVVGALMLMAGWRLRQRKQIN